VAVSFICCFLLGSASACDYQRVDPSHTMCVYTPRSCGGKTLIRESFSFFIYFLKNQNPVCCWVGFVYFSEFDNISITLHTVTQERLYFAIIIFFFQIFQMLKRRERNELSR
jgi:hypothetical protein